jgi:hypothetical protein
VLGLNDCALRINADPAASVCEFDFVQDYFCIDENAWPYEQSACFRDESARNHAQAVRPTLVYDGVTCVGADPSTRDDFWLVTMR